MIVQKMLQKKKILSDIKKCLKRFNILKILNYMIIWTKLLMEKMLLLILINILKNNKNKLNPRNIREIIDQLNYKLDKINNNAIERGK